MITTRKVVFTPSTDLKSTLASTSVSITCYDRNGDLVKRVTAAGTDVDSEGDTSGEDTENPTDTGGSGSTGSGSDTSGSGSSGSGSSGSGSDSGADSDGGGYYE